MRIEKLLVPVDFSPPSRLALNHAIAFARKFRAKLTLLHVLESSTALSLTFPAETAQMQKEHRDQARRMLSALVAPEDQDDLNLEILVKSGNIEDEILATVCEQSADLIVMGTHGRGLVGRSLIGSVAHNVLRKAEIPTLTVCRVTRFPAFDRILLATDLSEPSKEGSRLAFELAQMTHGNLVAVHSVEVGVAGGAEAAVYLSEPRLEEARAKLEEFKAEASRRKVEVETVVAEGPAADAILQTAEEKSADFIVITIPKSELMERTFVGSTAERVIREAHIPVLTIPIFVKAKPEQIKEPRAA